MKYLLSLIFVYFFSFQSSVISQVKLVSESELPKISGLNFQADVNGKVLITEMLYNKLISQQKLDPIEIYPGWPIQKTGNSNRGGIYCNLDSDPDLEVIYNIGTQVHAWNIDGSSVDGWPATVQLYPDGAPAFGDIDGDGEGDIVVSSRQAGTGNTGKLMAFHLDGSSVTGFPITLGGGATKTPVLADLNDDGALEIIVEERDYPDGYVGVYLGNGNPYPGFPVALDYIPGSAVAVGDITGDNIPEIVAESYYSVYAFDANGNVLEGFPYAPGANRVFSYSSPVLADMDGDGIREILVGDHSLTNGNGAIHIIKSNGSAFEGWPKYTGYWIYGPAAVGDIDGDGELDVAVGDQVLSGVPSNKVFAWDKNGNALPGWPTSPINSINNQIILADLDGDGNVELMWDDNTTANEYIGYNHDGTVMEGWPLSLDGSSFFMNPFVADLNNDGILDMSGAAQELTTDQLYFYLWNVNVAVNPNLAFLPILQYNVRHDGVYTDASVLYANFTASPAIICEGNTTQFNDQSTGSIQSWEWIFEGGDPSTSMEQNPIISYAASGEYDVSLTISDGSNSSSISKTDYIHVEYDPIIPDLPAGPTDFITDTANFTFYNTWAPNAVDYIWELVPDDVGVILEGDTITQVKIYWSTDENYSAELKVKAINVCGESEFSDALTIYVNWNTGLYQKEKDKPFSLQPNPSSGSFLLSFDDHFPIQTVKLFNAVGEEINLCRQEINQTLSISELSQGLYFLVIEGEGKQFIEKIIVK
ncbi:MAG: FG-GAP-like repeat-containing protein [Bacteroidales bacterium]|nr:FG-GAP-like repeat-containing protein [Bacteroidales bacterium]MCF8403521.1 FG-GAP-like repeat-containing protein [Bacteroidales bacterium]